MEDDQEVYRYGSRGRRFMSMSTLMETNDDNAFIGGSTFHMSVRIDALYGLERSMRCILARAVVSWRRQLLELLIRLFCHRYVYWHELRADQCTLCFRKKGLFGLVMYNVVGSQRTRCCPDSDLFVCSALSLLFFAAKGCAESAIGFGCSRTVPLFFVAAAAVFLLHMAFKTSLVKFFSRSLRSLKRQGSQIQFKTLLFTHSSRLLLCSWHDKTRVKSG